MKPSLLRLEDSFIADLALKPSPQAPDSSAEAKVGVEPSFSRHSTDPHKWRVCIKVNFGRSDEKPAAYEGHIEFVGFFTVVDESLADEKQRKLIAVNGPSILYSSAREIIALLTSRSQQGLFLLPSVSFIDQKVMPAEQESSESTLPAAKKSAA